MAILGLFSHLFTSFQTNIITILTTNICEKCPSSILCRDSNTQPSDNESPTITTRPGLLSRTYIDKVVLTTAAAVV